MAIHPLAIVEPGAEIASDAEVGPWCHVSSKARIGARTRLISHVVVNGRTILGAGNTVHPFAVLGGPPQDLKYRGEDTELLIGDDNTIREAATLNLGTVQGGGVTRLGSRNLVMAYVHLGHDSVVGNDVVLSNAVNLAGHVVVEDFAIIGGIVGAVQFRRVGAHAYVGGQAGIHLDVPPYCVVRRPCEIAGANIVGLKRRGMSLPTIQAVSGAITLWMRSDVQKDQCLLEIEAQFGNFPEVAAFVAFIRASEAGVAR